MSYGMIRCHSEEIVSATPDKPLIPNLDELLKRLGGSTVSTPLVSAFAATTIEEARTNLRKEIEARLERTEKVFRED